MPSWFCPWQPPNFFNSSFTTSPHSIPWSSCLPRQPSEATPVAATLFLLVNSFPKSVYLLVTLRQALDSAAGMLVQTEHSSTHQHVHGQRTSSSFPSNVLVLPGRGFLPSPLLLSPGPKRAARAPLLTSTFVLQAVPGSKPVRCGAACGAQLTATTRTARGLSPTCSSGSCFVPSGRHCAKGVGTA